MVRTPIAGRADIHALDQVRVTTLGGDTLPLSQLAQVEFSRCSDPNRSLQPRSRGHDQCRSSERLQHRSRDDRGVAPTRWRCSGRAAIPMCRAANWKSRAGEFRRSCRRRRSSALLGIVAVLVLEFGSFESTLIVLSVVPFGIAGGILALGLAGYSISFTATIGFIALIGIETKNSILLVDFTNQLRAEGMPLDEAIERAGEIRFLPILLTSATAIGGLLPLALQNAGMYSPLAWVIIGGLISSTLIARVVTPVMYKLIPPTIEVKKSAAASCNFTAQRRDTSPRRRLDRFLEPPLALRRKTESVFYAAAMASISISAPKCNSLHRDDRTRRAMRPSTSL